METLWVDFQNEGKEGVRLICTGTLKELKEKSIELIDGLELLIWSDDKDDCGKIDNLIVEATVKYSNIDQCWVAQFDNEKLRNQSEINK